MVLLALLTAAACGRAGRSGPTCQDDADCGVGIACRAAVCDSASVVSQVYGGFVYTATVSPASMSAGATATLTLLAKTVAGAPVAGVAVAFTAGGAGNTFSTASAGATDASGIFRARLSSTAAQTESITATLGGGADTVTAPLTVVPGPPSLARSSLSIAGAPLVADGASTAAIAVLVSDAYGNPIPGRAVSLTATGSANAFTATSGATDATGTFTSQLTSTRSGARTLSAAVPTVFVLSAPATFLPGRATATVTASPSTQVASSLGSIGVLVNLKDANGNPVVGEPVSLTLAPGQGTFTPSSGFTDSNGNLGGIKLTSTVAEQKTIVATDTAASGLSAGVTGTATVTFTPYTPVAATSSLTASPAAVPADAATGAQITVIARDASSNPVAGRTVKFAVTGVATGTAFTPASAVTDAAGRAQALFTSTTTGAKTVQVTVVNGYQASLLVNVTAGPLSASLSSVGAAPSTVQATGLAQAALTATVRDVFNNPMPGQAVLFASNGAGDVFSPGDSAVTNASGVASVRLSSTSATVQTIGASVGGVSFSGLATVTFTPGPPVAANSTLTLPSRARIADGTSAAAISVNLQDANHNLVAGRMVTLSSSAGVSFSPSSGVTDAGGSFVSAASSTSAGTKTIRAAVGTAFTLGGTVRFVAGPPLVTLSSSPATAGGSARIALSVADAQGNPYPAQPVTLQLLGATGSNLLTPAAAAGVSSGTTDASGTFVFGLVSTTAEVKSLAGAAPALAITGSGQVTFLAAAPAAAQSTLTIAPDADVPADGAAAADVTFVARDAYGNGCPGQAVSLAVPLDVASNIFAPASGATGTDGAFSARMTSTAAGARQVVATAGALQKSASITFVAPTPLRGIFTGAGDLTSTRSAPAAAALPDGKVLVAGGNYADAYGGATADLYDPATGLFTATGNLGQARQAPGAVALPDGKVLVAGGYNGSIGSVDTADLYDPATGSFTPANHMTSSRYDFTLTLLPGGKVLIAGGSDLLGATASAELYDPATGLFTATGTMTRERQGHTATLLPDGKVLIAGAESGSSRSSAELYDPATGLFFPTGSLGVARGGHTATLLPGGQVLVAGGYDGDRGVYLSSAELYDAAAGTFAPSGSMRAVRYHQTATALPGGKVLLAGGYGGGTTWLASAELYNPATGSFSATGSMSAKRYYHQAVVLPSGKVLVAGGMNNNGYLASAELYDPQDYPTAVLADAPSGYWQLADAPGSTTVADSSGHGNRGAVVDGAITFGVPGLVSSGNTAAFFPGGGYISVPDPASRAFSPGGAFSIEVWIKPYGDTFMVEKYDVPGYQGYAFRISGGKLLLYVAGSGTGLMVWDTPIVFRTTHHFVATVDATGLGTLYADGVAVQSAQLVVPLPGLYTNTLQIGARGDDKCCHLYGVLDEVAFYNGQALPPARVAAHYAAGQ